MRFEHSFCTSPLSYAWLFARFKSLMCPSSMSALIASTDAGGKYRPPFDSLAILGAIEPSKLENAYSHIKDEWFVINGGGSIPKVEKVSGLR